MRGGMENKTVILGGGVAGMSAAHELAERGFEVEVFEKGSIPGGKARSLSYDRSNDGLPALPAEHGFRFFPGFYWHLPDTMKRIPGPGGRSAFAHLKPTDEFQLAQANGKPEHFGPMQVPDSPGDLWKAVRFLWAFATRLDIPRAELLHFIKKIWEFMSSSQARLEHELEYQNWFDYCGAGGRSPAYRKFLAEGIVRAMVAARGSQISARTCGSMVVQTLYHLSSVGGKGDMVLDGPTNDVWIGPWLDHLRGGLDGKVEYHLDHEVKEIHYSDGRIAGVKVAGPNGAREVTGRHYIAAMPVEAMAPLVTEATKQAHRDLRGLDYLARNCTEWMNGVMFYLVQDKDLVCGHTIYVDSEWSLTSISQQQFWRPDYLLEEMSDGQAHGILSVDVSDWETPGSNGLPAQECTRAQIVAEVWEQLKAHLNNGATKVLEDSNRHDCFLDEDICWSPGRPAQNREPLLINLTGSWDHRPKAKSSIPNLFLAADYVRTQINLATMEGANEAARAAVNEILALEEYPGDPCELRPLWHPPLIRALQLADSIRFRHSKPHKLAGYELIDRPGITPVSLADEAKAIEQWLGNPEDDPAPASLVTT
jgi:uncharacterized protein with NAD-binding domain and iron-sulfur cluster